MNKITVTQVAPEVECCYVPFDKSKTAQLSVTFYLPLSEDTVSGASLLPFMLTGCGAGYEDMRALNRRLAELYGASLSCSCNKVADMQVLRMSIESLEGRYVPDGSDVFFESAKLLCSLIFDPLVSNGRFEERNFAREKRLALERIDGEINDKRRFARARCEAEMCLGEPFGIAANGSREGVEQMTAERLYGVWQRLLATAKVRVSVAAAESPEHIFKLFAERFGAVERTPCTLSYSRHVGREEVQHITEPMPVTQCKLVMGFAFDMTGDDRASYPMMVCTDLFGGGPHSRLFANVREKLSLCYYCSASASRRKGVMLVDSGVEAANLERTHDAILEQLEVVKQGGFTDEELAASKRSLCESLRSFYDSGKSIARWYADRVFDDDPLSPDEVRSRIETVTREQVMQAAASIQLDTVYRLVPEEAAQ